MAVMEFSRAIALGSRASTTRTMTQNSKHRQLLLLLLLLPSLCSASVAVHDAEISVKSVRSIVYRDTQISLFKSDDHPDRLFHQPLSFLDTKSLRILPDVEMNRTRLYVDIFLWTKEFVELVRLENKNRVTVELMPLTHLRLTWSSSASDWLGEKFNESYRLVGGWHDGDKPRMRTTFAIECLKGRVSCQQLQNRLNVTDGTAPQVLDLRYRVRGDRSEHLLMSVRSRHLLQSDTFQLLSRFSRQLRIRRVLLLDSTVDNLVKETLVATLLQRERDTGKEIADIDLADRQAVESSLHRLFRSDSVASPSKEQWRKQVFWPDDRNSLRPDKLALMLNNLLTPVTTKLVRLADNWQEVLVEIRQSTPVRVAGKIGDFAHARRPRPRENRTIDIDDVIGLAESMDTSVAWDALSRRFRPATAGLLYRLNVEDLKSRGNLAMHQVRLSIRKVEHRDHVTLVNFDSATGKSDAACCGRFLDFSSQLSSLRQNCTAGVESVSNRLNEFMQQLAPVQNRKSDTIDLPAETARYQKYFADSFCILAHFKDPAGMHCDTIGFHIPRKSLRYSPIFDRTVRYRLGRMGSSSFTRMNSRFFKLQLRVCCTV